MQFESFLPTTSTDFVQFLAIAVVIYGVLRVVRGTIAASILRGALLMVAVVVVLAAFLLSALELTVLQSILSYILGAVVTALIVVFQPELRRGLLSLGEHSLFDRFRPRPRTGIDDLSRAVVNLARDRHGALFAVERRAALHHITATGVSLDAEVRADLLANIFWPGAPMHDGGVVIRGDRVVAAGCIFPLAERRDLATRLGTRHRAGIGLSEESDAVIVIVSEETGGVSLAVDGDLRPVDPPGDVGRLLREALATQTAPEPPALPQDATSGDTADGAGSDGEDESGTGTGERAGPSAAGRDGTADGRNRAADGRDDTQSDDRGGNEGPSRATEDAA